MTPFEQQGVKLLHDYASRDEKIPASVVSEFFEQDIQALLKFGKAQGKADPHIEKLQKEYDVASAVNSFLRHAEALGIFPEANQLAQDAGFETVTHDKVSLLRKEIDRALGRDTEEGLKAYAIHEALRSLAAHLFYKEPRKVAASQILWSTLGLTVPR